VSVVASTLSAGWAGVCGLIVEGQLVDFYRHSLPHHVVAFLLIGAAKVANGSPDGPASPRVLGKRWVGPAIAWISHRC
jgi:hypothetical protein